MALKQCKECGGQVSDKAPLCPSCGAKQPKKTGVLTWILVIFVVLFVIGAIVGGAKEQIEENSKHQGVSKSNESVATKEEQQQLNWVYQTSKDDLYGQDIQFAATESTNKVYFDSPYSGGSSLILTVRKNHTGFDVYIAVTKGQFVCGISSGCDVAFKFDDGEVMQVTMVKSDSYASDILFVKLDSTEEKIINRLKSSNKLIIAPNFYKHGVSQFTFNVSNYRPI